MNDKIAPPSDGNPSSSRLLPQITTERGTPAVYADTANAIVKGGLSREFLRRRANAVKSAEAKLESQMEHLFFDTTQRSLMWRQIIDILGRDTDRSLSMQPLFIKEFSPPLSASKSDHLSEASMIEQIISTYYPEDTASYYARKDPAGNTKSILITPELWAKVRACIVGSGLLAAGVLGREATTGSGNDDQDGNATSKGYTLTYPEPVITNVTAGRTKPTLLGEIVKESLEICRRKDDTTLVAGTDFRFSELSNVDKQSFEARTVTISAPAYLSAVKPAIEGVAKGTLI